MLPPPAGRPVLLREEVKEKISPCGFSPRRLQTAWVTGVRTWRTKQTGRRCLRPPKDFDHFTFYCVAGKKITKLLILNVFWEERVSVRLRFVPCLEVQFTGFLQGSFRVPTEFLNGSYRVATGVLDTDVAVVSLCQLNL